MPRIEEPIGRHGAPDEEARPRAIVLVVSDTHLTEGTLHKMPPEVWVLAAAADVIVHAGDVVDAAVLRAFAEHAPVHGVLGNNDRGLGDDLPDDVELELAGVRVAVLHDAGPAAGRESRMARRFPQAEVVIFGHSHEPVIRRTDSGVWLVNPGSPTQRRRQPVHSVARLELADGEVDRAELIEVGPLAR